MYLNRQVAEPAGAPDIVRVSHGRKALSLGHEEGATVRDETAELNEEAYFERDFLMQGGWTIEDPPGPVGRPPKGMRDPAILEVEARKRLDGNFEAALQTLKRGPIPKYIDASVRVLAESVIAYMVNEMHANPQVLAEVFECKKRVIQKIASNARNPRKDEGD